MPFPTASQVHVNQPLTDLSVAYLQDANNFVSNRVFPSVPVSKQSDRYYTYDRGDFNRDEAQVRAPGTESAGNGFNIDNTPTYYCDVWAFHRDLPDQVVANADSVLRPQREATEYLMHKMLIRQEQEFVSTYMAGGVWSYDYDGVASSPGANEVIQWDDYTNSDPIGDVQDGRRAVMLSTGKVPNVLVLGRPVYDALINHPDMIDRVKYGQTPGSPAMVNQDALAAIFEVDRVLVMDAIVNDADQGQTNSHSFIGGNTALLAYSAPSPGIMTPSAGYVFRWNGFMGGAGGDMGTAIKTFRMEELESERVEAQAAFDMKLVSADLGAFWDAIVA